MKLIALSLLFASATFSMAQNPSDYVPKVYPQQQETASTARLVQDGDTYTFSNNLFEAKFIKQDGTLKFGGCEQMNLMAGTELFTVKFGDGSVVRKASEMTLLKVETKHLNGSDKAVKGSHHFDGESLVATFTTEYDGKTITLTWTAELREGSHYLKTNLDIKASDDVKMFAVIPMQYNFNATDAKAPMPQGDPRLRGRVLSNGSMFACLDTPTAFNTAGGSTKDTSFDAADVLSTATDNWIPQSWATIDNNDNVPWRIREFGYDNNSVKSYNVRTVEVTESGSVNVEFLYQSGNNRLNMVGVELIDSNGQVAGGDYHIGYTGNAKENNVYSIDVKTAGTYTVRCYVQGKTEPLNSSGTITTRVIRKAVEEMNTADIVPLEGLWKRDATLRKDEPWSVGSVVGLMAEGQDRRSFLAYLERERAVPWRPFPMYNSWYEINIGRTNTHSDPAQNMKVEDAVRVVQHWKEKMFDNYGVSIKSFVWDDGWDNLSTWEPSCNFPNGFSEPKAITDAMCSYQGAWLGPTGGYDTAGNARKAYWSDKGGAGMHNRAYYEAFTSAVKNLCNNYDFNYYKFDGIGGPATAFAPREGNDGNEQCEGIIALERDIRNTIQEDVFFNTTVGTWASPLWLNISDCVWRQDQDHYLQGNNTNTRERWITYRDNLIYEHFVDESPLMTINSMMSHGFILTKYGLDITKNMPRDFESVKREMRCAFACGSSQVELYCDYDLMDSICKEENNPETAGALWEELANCIKWQRKNADVLPDIHWVGNDPYTTQENIYGWAAWNGNKAVFSLRNGNNNEQSYEFTLREALNIPTSAPTTTITFTKPFADQADLFGLNVGEPINIDTRLTVKLPGSTVYMFDGIDNSGELVLVNNLSFDAESIDIPVGVAKAPAYLVSPLSASNKSLEWTSADPTIAKVTDGAITALKIGTTTITAKALDGSNKTMTITVNVTENKKFDLDKVIEEITETYEANNVDTWGEKIIKDNSVFSSNASDSTEGQSFPLTDGSGTTYWHSNYHNGNQASHSHYLQVTLPTAVEGTLQVEMMRRINDGKLCANDNPLEFDVQVSATGNDDDWTSVGNITFPLGSVEEPTVTNAFTVDAPYRYFRFWCTKTNGANRGYFHVGDFQLKPLVTPSLNSTHVAAAEALQAALADARKLTEVTDEHIAALQQAFEDYKTAIGQEVTPPAEPSNYEWGSSDWKEASFGTKAAVADKTNFYGACYYDYNNELTVDAGGKVSATLTYEGGSHAQGIYGIQLIRKDGTVASNARALHAPSAAGALDDYKFGTVGGNPRTQTYTVDGVPAGTYTLRVWSCATNDEMTMTANGKLEVNVNDSKVGENTWDKTSWKIDNSIIPETVKEDAKMVKIGVTLDEDKNRGINRYYRYLDKEMTFDKATTLTATVTSNDDAKTMELIGVELLKADGTLVTTEGSYDGHYGTIGQAGNVDNVYSLNIPEAGTYTVRVWASYVKDVVAATGTAAYEQPTTDEPTVPTYTITSARGTFFSGDEYVLNTTQTSVASSVTDANKQWIYVPATIVGGEENSYFFYNVGTDKFMSVSDDAKLTVSSDPTSTYYKWENGNANYGFTIGDTYKSVAGGTKVLNSTTWQDSNTGVRFWQCAYDDGNRLAIEEVGTITQAQYDAIVKRIKDYYTLDTSLEEAKAQFDEVKASAYDLVEEYKYNEVEGVQDMLLEFISKVIGLNMELSQKPEEEMTAEDYLNGANRVQTMLDEAVAELQALNFGRTFPIPAGIYEIQNAESRDNRGYLVDYKGWGNGPALAECKLNGHVDKHPTDRNEEGVTSSYWYVYPKTVGETVQYYIFNLGSLQEDGLPRFLKPGAARSARTTYTYAPEALVIKEHTTTYTVGDNTYKHMLISDAATPNIVMSAACGKTSDSGDAVGADENVNDGGAVWQFNNTWMRLTDTQKETLDRAIQYINGEATISGAVLVIEKAKAGKAQKNDIDRLSDIILQK